MNTKIIEKLEELSYYDPCARISPQFLADLLCDIFVLADPVNLNNYMYSGAHLPEFANSFTYDGFPCHVRCVEHNGTMYLVLCSYHNGNSGVSGCNYVMFHQQGPDNLFYYNSKYTANTVPDWIKRAFGEATATASYPGIMSNTMYKRLDAVYQWCVAQGMNPVN